MRFVYITVYCQGRAAITIYTANRNHAFLLSLITCPDYAYSPQRRFQYQFQSSHCFNLRGQSPLAEICRAQFYPRSAPTSLRVYCFPHAGLLRSEEQALALWNVEQRPSEEQEEECPNSVRTPPAHTWRFDEVRLSVSLGRVYGEVMGVRDWMQH